MEQKHKSTLRALLIAGNSAFGCIYYGYAMNYLGPTKDPIPVLNNIFVISDTDYNLLTALVPLGACLGAFILQYLLKYFSRKQTFMITDIVGIISVGLSLIQELNLFYVVRFLIGVTVGLNSSLVPIYIKEYTPIAVRGSAGTLNQIFCCMGGLSANLMGLIYYSANQNYNKDQQNTVDITAYRWVFGLPLIFCVFRLIGLNVFFRSDPPGYYVSKNEQNDALEVLNEIYKKEHVEQEFQELLSENKINKSSNSQSYSMLISRKYRYRFFIGICLVFFQQFSGVNVIIFYSSTIFKEVTDSILFVYVLVIGVNLVNFIFSLIASTFTDKFGRKQILFYGNTFCFLNMVAATIIAQITNRDEYLNILYIVFLFLFLIGFQFSLGPVVWLHLPEILPELGVFMCVLINWFFVFIVSFALQGIDTKYQFIIFSVCCFIGSLFFYFVLKETLGKTQQEIDEIYSSNVSLLSNKINDATNTDDNENRSFN